MHQHQRASPTGVSGFRRLMISEGESLPRETFGLGAKMARLAKKPTKNEDQGILG